MFDARDVLLKAAERISEPGKWCQGSMYDQKGRACAMGHIISVAAELSDMDLFTPAIDLFEWHLKGAIPSFNDTPGRTAHEVAEAMRAAAS